MISRVKEADSSRYFWALILFSLIAYTLPWLDTPPAATTNNAYDLAEWASLHPASYQTSPLILTSLLLRLQLVLFTGMIAATMSEHFSRSWWFKAGIILLLAIAQLPPVEFIDNPGDINYQQQFLMAASSLVVGAVGLTGRLFRFRQWITLLLVIGGGVSSLIGMVQARELYGQFGLSPSIGVGGVSLTVLYISIGLYAAKQIYLHRAMGNK